jgi:SPP1 gp7 family putative phage head morphogenesis protein
MAKTGKYWEERFRQLEESQHKSAASCYEDIEQQYHQAQRTLEGQIAAWYQRFANNNGMSLAEAKKVLNRKELEEFKWDVWQYIKYAKENEVTEEWTKELENASARYHISRLQSLQVQTQQTLEVMFGNQLDTIDEEMRDAYTSGYYHTAYEIQKGAGIGWNFATLDERIIAKVIHTPWAVDGKNFSERIWGNKQKLINELNQILTQNIILGQDPQKAIDALAKKMNVSKVNAGRLVMTEEAYFSSEAQKDCFKELDVEQYQIVATLDLKTCDVCQEMDGKVFRLSEREVGVTAPPFHVNCRTTTKPYSEFNDFGERIARGEDGKTYYVPANMTYKEWKKAYVDGDKSGLEQTKAKDVDNTELEDLKKQFSNITDGYSYDDFMSDFSSIEEGFEGASESEIKRAKEISEKIKLIEGDSKTSKAESPVERLKNIGIDLNNTSSSPVSDDVLNKYADFITDFENTHPGYFNNNKLQLQSIDLVDNVKGAGSAGGRYNDGTHSIEIKTSGIRPKQSADLSKSDDFELHNLAHEYGHYVADTLEHNVQVSDADVVQNTILKYFDGDIFKSTKDLKECLGPYGSTSYGEAFAEAFAEAYTCEEPRKFAKLFKEELESAMKRVAKHSNAGIIDSVSTDLPMNLQFFAEKDIKNQESNSLKRAIRKYEARIKEHEDKISNPEKYIDNWNELDTRKQDGLKKHWEKENRNFNESIQNRVNELKDRGDYDGE